MEVKPPDAKQSNVRNPSPRTKKLITKNSGASAIRNCLKENVTSNDDVLNTLCMQLDELGVETLDDFKNLDEEDVDAFGLKKITKKKFMKLISESDTNPTTNQVKTSITISGGNNESNVTQAAENNVCNNSNAQDSKQDDDKKAKVAELNAKYLKEFPKGTPYIVACENGNLEDVKTYVESGTIVDLFKEGFTLWGQPPGDEPRTPISAAMKNNHQHIIDYLVDYFFKDLSELERKYIKEVPPKYGKNSAPTPLYVACENGNLADVKTFIESGVIQDSDGEFAAGLRVTKEDAVKEYLISKMDELDVKYAKSHPSYDPFIAACETANLEDVKAYVGKGRSVNVRNGPLCAAVEYDQKHPTIYHSDNKMLLPSEVVKYLLSLPDTTVNVTDFQEMNPMHLAAGRHTEPDILKLLLAHKTCTADVLNARCIGEDGGNTVIDQIGWTQGHGWGKYSYPRDKKAEHFQELISSKGGRSKEELKKPPLIIAALYEDIEMVKKILLEDNADVGVKCRMNGFEDGNYNCFHAAACSKKNLETLNLLLAHRTFKVEHLSDVLGSIPKKISVNGEIKDNPLKNDIFQLLKSKGATEEDFFVVEEDDY